MSNKVVSKNSESLYAMCALLCLLVLMTGCQSNSSTPQGRYTQHQDSAPNYIADIPLPSSAVPKYEPYAQYTLRPYEVLGKSYTPLHTGKGYETIGYASWYGQKFHGHLTSNGETYNMFAMTAAHKTLPLPSYVRVTNLDNNKQVIVRVNDRGPFHDNRVIDLSYAAAVHLDYKNKGTARVKLEVIHFDEDKNVTIGNRPTQSYDEYLGLTPLPKPAPRQTSNVDPSAYYVQVVASSNKQRIESISKVLTALYQVNVALPQVNNVYKLQLGPLVDETHAMSLVNQLKQSGYPQAYTIRPSS